MVLPKKYWKKMMKKKKEKEMLISLKKMAMDFPVIPDDLLIEIFLRLPVQSLLRFRWVCKSCFNSIRDPSFVNMQLYYYNYNITRHKPNNNNNNNNPALVLIYNYIDNQHNLKLNSYNMMDDTCPHGPHSLVVTAKGPSPETFWYSFKILGTCNGLLCIGVGKYCVSETTYFIWNPCTDEYKKASDHRNDLCCGLGYECFNRYGFGYDRTIDDYKLVKTTVIRHNNGDHKTCVYVYTLGTNLWKKVRSSYKFRLCSTTKEHDIINVNGLFISGHLYYTAMKTSSETFDIIVSFDIAKEEYQQITIPDKVGVRNLGELKGCLCLLCSHILSNGHWEVWMMRHNVESNMDVKEGYTWEKLYTISSVHISSVDRSWITKLLRFCENGEILMVMVMVECSKKEIVLCDPKSGNITVLHQVNFDASVENYIESLVSLNTDTYMAPYMIELA